MSSSSTTSDYILDGINYLLITLIVFGLIGNFITLKIYSSQRRLRKLSISLYFRAISVFDTLMLIDAFIYFLDQKFNYNVSLVDDFFCKTNDYFSYAIGPISPWIMVFISIDRFLNITYPKKFPLFFKTNFQIVTICLIFAFNYVYYSFIVWNSYLVVSSNSSDTNETYCEQNLNETTLSWMDLFNSTVLPFLFMILLSMAVIYAVKRSRSRVCASINISTQRKNTLTPVIVNTTIRRATLFSHSKDINNNNNNNGMDTANLVVVSNNNKSNTKTRDRKFAIATVALNVIFLLLNLPVTLYDQYTSFIDVDPEVDAILSFLFEVLWYLYYAIGFYAQMAVNSAFRNEFFALLKLKPMSGLSVNYTATKSKTENE